MRHYFCLKKTEQPCCRHGVDLFKVPQICVRLTVTAGGGVNKPRAGQTAFTPGAENDQAARVFRLFIVAIGLTRHSLKLCAIVQCSTRQSRCFSL
jgi:hypothetical protein